MGNPIPSARRLACLALVFVVAFLSYRPAISLLSIAGVARNPTEDQPTTGDSVLVPRENLPRPEKKRQCEARGRLVQKIQKSKSASQQGKALPAIPRLGPGSGMSGISSEGSFRIAGVVARPEYLKLFLPAIPGSPQSPPA